MAPSREEGRGFREVSLGQYPALVAERRLTQQVHLASPGDGLGAIGCSELAVDVVDVRLNRAHRDEEVACDLGVGVPEARSVRTSSSRSLNGS